MNNYDVIVVGAGHAGIEAALASARLDVPTLLLTITLDAVGRMSCNPAIGGPAKSQLVFELDALGGEMGRASDHTYLQMKILNTSKGPAVQALRAQSDRKEYERYMKRIVENQPNLDLKQGEAVELLFDGKRFCGVRVRQNFEYFAKAVVLAAGTFLRGKIHIGLENIEAGRAGEPPATALTESLTKAGIATGRLKTGTVPRLDRRTIDFAKMEEAPGLIDYPRFFSSDTINSQRPHFSCWMTRTTKKTHELILANLDRSPLYQKIIDGVGPRYCPSIEDKVVRFADKESHLLFLEPEGADTNEMYIQGLSTSLPIDIQKKILETIPGLEKAEIMRPGYAIEYDFIFPEQLDAALKIKDLTGVYSAGQINGTSGYEEAASQGLVAGINAAQFVLDKEPLLLTREDSYIGTLIDDLITKEIREPYRMMTSRSEYRLFLRQDNADDRLLQKGHFIGLVSDEKYQKYQKSRKRIDAEVERLQQFKITTCKQNQDILAKLNQRISASITAFDLLKRMGITYRDLAVFGYALSELSEREIEKMSIEIRYADYLEDVLRQIAQSKKAEKRKIPDNFDYEAVLSLRKEAREKLKKIKPATIGQASRIAGVNPADIALLLIWLQKG
jgi:tRNA uridine 5-carboxymethylaminomethyl modification enzyme